MSNAGMSNYKGVNYQAWAAMLLFLIRADDGKFESITLEDPEWEDFTLNYADGKKIVCESKYRSRNLTAGLLKEILQNIADSDKELDDADEILIVCPSVSPELESNVKYIRWSAGEIEKWFKARGFSQKLINLIPKVSFFKAPSSEYLYGESLSYFYNLSGVGYTWLPKNEVEQWMKAVLIDHVYDKSAQGETFTRMQLSELIGGYLKDKINLNGVYDSEQNEVKEQYKILLTAIKNKDMLALKRDLQVLSSQPQLMHIAIDAVFKQSGLKLREWDLLWSSLIDRQYWFRIVHELRSRIDEVDDAEYILELFTVHVDAFTNPAFDDFRTEYAIQNVREIIKKHPQLTDKAYDFISKFLKEKRIDYHELDDQGGRQEKVEVAQLLSECYKHYEEQGDSVKINEILELASRQFDLVGDDGEYAIYTPGPIFAIFRDFLKADLTSNLGRVIDIVTSQYASSKYYDGNFKGWELMGGTFSQSVHEFTIVDRHFLGQIIVPELRQYYKENPAAAWQLIDNDFVARTKEDVSARKPDFLGRAAIPLLINEFNDGQYSNEAFELLKAQMLMKKGIPAKHELIFQEVRNRTDLSDIKVWKLAKAYLDEYSLPYTVFIEQVVSDLAVKGHPEALSAIQGWIENEDYRKQQQRHSFFVGQSMFKLLATEPGSGSFNTGVSILKYYLATDDYRIHLDSFDSYDISGTIAKIVEQDYETGLGILWDIYRSSNDLTRNEQTAIWLAIEQVNKEDEELLGKLYDDFVKPVVVDDLESSIEKVVARFKDHYPRELIVQYAQNLGKAGHMEQAITLARIFMSDPNPSTENEPDDPDGTFNYHKRILNGEDPHTINTVRGWNAWVLSTFVSMRGKDYLDEVTDLTGALTTDKNLYVRAQATIPLAGLAQNRHSVLPKTDTRFISPALAQKIEDITFKMLSENDNPVVLKHLEAVLHRIKSMSVEQALQVFEVFGVTALAPKTDDGDIYTLLAYFALFRKDDFKEERLKTLFGEELYTAINSFNDTPFKELLEKSIRNGSDEIRTHIGWYFWTLPKKSDGNFDEIFALSHHYMGILSEKYTREAFTRIGYFIHEHLEAKPEECLELWEEIILKERDWLRDNAETIQPHEWWTHHYHSEFLIKAREISGDDRYLDNLETLLSYPDKFSLMIGPDENYGILMEIDTDRAKSLLEKLKSFYPQLYTKDEQQL